MVNSKKPNKREETLSSTVVASNACGFHDQSLAIDPLLTWGINRKSTESLINPMQSHTTFSVFKSHPIVLPFSSTTGAHLSIHLHWECKSTQTEAR